MREFRNSEYEERAVGELPGEGKPLAMSPSFLRVSMLPPGFRVFSSMAGFDMLSRCLWP